MGRYKKILVGYDGSSSSDNALHQSFRLANNEKSWITVTTVVPEYLGELDLTVGKVNQALHRQGIDLLSRAEQIARREGALIKTVLEEGEIYERLVDLAESENCSVIMLGRRGVSSLERALIGSVAARVIGHSQRDVLIVPIGTGIGWQNILFATDGSKYSFFASQKAINFANSYGGKITAISVVDVPDELYAEAPSVVEQLVAKAKEYVKRIEEEARSEGIAVETFVREGASYSAIVKIAVETRADLIVMGSHGRTGLKRLLMGSVTEKVIGNAPCPVLVVKT